MTNLISDSIRDDIYRIVKIIPLGRATSYGAIARSIGYPNHSRLVGKILSNIIELDNNIPAHRVVNSLGILVAKNNFASEDKMQVLLEAEGIVIKNNRIVNWRKIFWDPFEEL